MSLEHCIQRIMSGQAKGTLPSLGRLALGAIEPVYRFAVERRNRQFDCDVSRIRRLPRPVIAVGNLTTGGTGKTPVIRWLAGALRDRGLNVAILARGYNSTPGTLGDEQRMLLAMLSPKDGPWDRPAPAPPSPSSMSSTSPLASWRWAPGGAGAWRSQIVIECHPDRHAAGLQALDRHPAIDVFLLDDGFQHRRLHRDLDIVLLHAPEPFGYGHVLPRGLLREPIAGLRRAGVVVLTSADGAAADSRSATIAEVCRLNPTVAIALERHAPTGLRSPATHTGKPTDVPLGALAGRSAFCFSGLGSPGGFERQIQSLARTVAGSHRFGDHHAYSAGDIDRVQELAEGAGADVLVTTEKDWVKLSDIPGSASTRLPIWRLDIEATFDDGEETVLQAVLSAFESGRHSLT